MKHSTPQHPTGAETHILIRGFESGSRDRDPNISAISTVRTTRWLWFLAYGIIVATIALHLTFALKEARGRIPRDIVEPLGDERLASVSLTVAGVLVIVGMALAIALYLAIAAFLDRRLIPTKARVGRRWHVGAYFVIAVCSILPTRLLAVMTQQSDLRGIAGIWYYVYFFAVTLGVLALFRQHWWRLSIQRRIVVTCSALALSVLAAML